MKEILKNINKAFENKLRLGIMSALMVNDSLDFNALKELLDATDGNLASHLRTLETKGYVKFEKDFIDRKPNTKYFVTKSGRNAFLKHLKAIEDLLNKI